MSPCALSTPGNQQIDGCHGSADGLEATADYDGNWVTMVIPRHCLQYQAHRNGPPKWVRVSVATGHTRAADRPDVPFYFDRLRAQAPDPWTILNVANSHFTPRLYPG